MVAQGVFVQTAFSCFPRQMCSSSAWWPCFLSRKELRFPLFFFFFWCLCVCVWYFLICHLYTHQLEKQCFRHLWWIWCVFKSICFPPLTRSNLKLGVKVMTPQIPLPFIQGNLRHSLQMKAITATILLAAWEPDIFLCQSSLVLNHYLLLHTRAAHNPFSQSRVTW